VLTIKLTKDFCSSSFKPKNVPAIFFVQSEYQTNLQVTHDYKPLRKPDHGYMVNLTCKLSATKAGLEAYQLTVVQSGVFEITADEEISQHVLEEAIAVHCLERLFPYARTIITQLLLSGGFPIVVLPQIDFKQRYASRTEAGEDAEAAASVRLSP